jgi:tetratricopeptide (TPR) repeat protein
LIALAFALLLLAADPKQALPLIQRGLLDLQQGKLTEAQSTLEQAAKLDPANPYVWTSLAETYLRLKRPQQAQEAAQKAEGAGNGNPVVAHALAMFYSKTGEFGRAAQFEEQFAASNGADAGALDRAASLYLNAGDAAKAIPLAREAARAHPSAAAEDTLGRALVAAGQPDEGRKRLAEAWKQQNSSAEIAFDYVQLLLHDQDFTEAAAVLEQALRSNPKNAQLTLALGVARYGQRRFEEAIVAFLNTIAIDPRIEQPYVFLGRMLDQAGSHLAAVKKADEAWAAANPKNAAAQLQLAKTILASGGGQDQVEPLLRRAIALDSRNWEAHYQLGLLLSKKHAYREAAEELTSSIKLNPKDPLPHYHLARVYDRLGMPGRAREEREIHQRLTSPTGGGMSNVAPQ